MSQASLATYRRHSFLKRASGWSHGDFSHYYEHHHGLLAAGLHGFRKFATRYIQNHVDYLPYGADPPFDGVSMTTQVPREDYSRGFFNEPDYETAKIDEERLFDLTRTASVLGVEEIVRRGTTSPYKALIITSRQSLQSIQLLRPTKLVLNHLEPSTASALGFGSTMFEYDLLAEAWFENKDARMNAFGASHLIPSNTAPTLFLLVREVVIFGPEKPWGSS